jgi:hypothetical protein
MKKGDLRRFNGPLTGVTGFSVGDLFVILDIVQPRSAFPQQVTFLVGGQVEEGWGFPWVMNNSEVLSEAG